MQGFDARRGEIDAFASLFNDAYFLPRTDTTRGGAPPGRRAWCPIWPRPAMFSIDTESGFDQVVFITRLGLGEMAVQVNR